MDDKRLSFSFHSCLGKGGFGEVYLATLTRPGGLGRRVAVKVLKQDLRNATEAVQRLRDEGRMLAILDHPCILRVLEMTLIQGRVALVTEFIDGVDLARCCKKGSLLPQTVVVGVLGEVASALHCAWTTPSPETGKPLKLIHRDVKPENIRIGKHGAVKLLDFGIARTTEMFRHAKTAQGDLPFTPGYAAPEAFTKGFQGSASDIYALGVTMYRTLVGERLYDGMDLADQVTIACLRERYTPFLRKRLALVDTHPDLKILVSDMLNYEAVDRPGAQEVEDRCAALSSEMEGPTHTRWARATQFPDPVALRNGSLTGQTLTEDNLSTPGPRTVRGVRLKPRAESSRGLLNQPDRLPPRPQASQRGVAPAAVADLTPPPDPSTELPVAQQPSLEPPPPVRSAAPPSMPPPLPDALTGLGDSVGPQPLDAQAIAPEPFNNAATLDAFVYEADRAEAEASLEVNPTLEPTKPPAPRVVPPPPLPPRAPDMPTVDFPAGLGTLSLEDVPTARIGMVSPQAPVVEVRASGGVPIWVAVGVIGVALVIGSVGVICFLLAIVLVIFL